MGDDSKTGITAQTALYGAAAVLLALLGWIGSMMTGLVEDNRKNIHEIELSISKLVARIDEHKHYDESKP